MKKILIGINLSSAVISIGLLMYVSLYGPVAVVPFERIITAPQDNSLVPAQDIASKLAEAHSGYYQFLAIPLFGVLLVLILSILSVVFLVRCKDVVHSTSPL